MTGLALAGFALATATYLSASVPLILAGAVVDGAGLVWLVAVAGTVIQRYTPPRLQGRASAAWNMIVITPQTVSIAVGAALITYISYRVLLLAVIAAIGACAVYLLAWPAAEPVTSDPGDRPREAPALPAPGPALPAPGPAPRSGAA
jgi:MFS family permease